MFMSFNSAKKYCLPINTRRYLRLLTGSDQQLALSLILIAGHKKAITKGRAEYKVPHKTRIDKNN